MSKRKLGASLLTMFALVLMFSITALAADPVGVAIDKATLNDQGILEVVWTPDAGATDYTVTVRDVTNNVDKTGEASIDKTTTYTVTLSTVPSTQYAVKIVTVDGVNATGETVFNAFTPASNPELEINLEDVDNGLGNANNTGSGVTTNNGTTVNDVIKSQGMVTNNGTANQTHRTHGEYQNNTNSCASCHQTHTGASKGLLFKDGVYNTCTACHDGTLGFYNVFDHSNAGTFGGTEAGNMSVHLADGTLQVKAAPGGNLSANSGDWINEFNCASCHSPHGSYSERLLHYNPNGMGLKSPEDGGIGIVGAQVYTLTTMPDATAADAPKNILVKGLASDFGFVARDIGGNEPTTTTAIVVFDLKLGSYSSPNSYVKSTVPWLYGYGEYASPKKHYAKFFTTDVEADKYLVANSKYPNIINYDDQVKGVLGINFGKAVIWEKTGGTQLASIKSADIGRAYEVDLQLVEISNFGGVPIYKSELSGLLSGGKGVKMSTYCASCHVDYLASSGEASGEFSSAYRHTTTKDSYTCVRCHFAHGTDVEIMKDAEGHTVEQIVADTTNYFPLVTDLTQRENLATDYMKDKNASSALKRFTNMAVCWSCHTSSSAEQLINNSKFGDNDGLEDPHGLPTGN